MTFKLVQNDSITRMEFALLRVEKSAENQLLFCVSDAEVKIELEFSNAEIAVIFDLKTFKSQRLDTFYRTFNASMGFCTSTSIEFARFFYHKQKCQFL